MSACGFEFYPLKDKIHIHTQACNIVYVHVPVCELWMKHLLFRDGNKHLLKHIARSADCTYQIKRP